MTAEHNSVLVVDDRVENRDLIKTVLVLGGYATEQAGTIEEAIDRIRTLSIGLVLTHMRMRTADDGLELLRRIKREWPSLPVVVYAAFGSVHDAVVATKLGAADYLEWPLEPHAILAAIKAALAGANSLPPAAIAPHSSPRMLSASARWALFVLRAANSPDDPKTLSAWARCVGVSYTSLREACYLLKIQPHDARDFARALRVVLKLSMGGAKLTTLLDVSDRRGVSWFCQRAGLAVDGSSHLISLETFLDCQTLIPHDNEGLAAIRQALVTEGYGVELSKPSQILR